jgi:hypothetical protein
MADHSAQLGELHRKRKKQDLTPADSAKRAYRRCILVTIIITCHHKDGHIPRFGLFVEDNEDYSVRASI